MEKQFIDIEPTWVSLCRSIAQVCAHRELVKELEPACAIADMIRAEQKKGNNFVTLQIHNDGVSVYRVDA